MKYKLISAMVATLSVNSPLYADTNTAAVEGAELAPVEVAEDHQEAGPAMLLEQGMNKMIEFFAEDERPGKEALEAFLAKEIAPMFDFAYMTKSAAGPMYRHMENEQRERMTENIQQQFMASMVEHLAGYTRQQLRVVSQRYGQRGYTAVVSAAVIRPRGYPARLDFRFYRAKGGWKAFDVSANGQSAVIHYRRQFRQMMYAAHYERQGVDGKQQMRRTFRHPTSQ